MILLTVTLYLTLFFALTSPQDECLHGDIRLVGGRSYLEGRVEVCFGGNWGTVCDDDWNTDDAKVACRQLGVSDQGSIAVPGGGIFPHGSGRVFFDDLQCNGNEESLHECYQHNNCRHEEDAGVICRNDDVELVYNGMMLPNNSVLSLNGLGSRSILCTTSLQQCCLTRRAGSWFYDDERLGEYENSTEWELYQSWQDDRSVRLNRGSEAAFIEGGLYYCEIPDVDNNLQYLYIGIYSADSEGSVSITSMTYESGSQTLVCTSTGGPATSVTWSRDNTPLVVDGTTYEHSQIITDTNTATYQNRLRIVSKSSSLSGSYTCYVANSRGEAISAAKISICRNDEARVIRGSSTDLGVVEICVDDVWITLNIFTPGVSASPPAESSCDRSMVTSTTIIVPTAAAILCVIVIFVAVVSVLWSRRKGVQTGQNDEPDINPIFGFSGVQSAPALGTQHTQI